MGKKADALLASWADGDTRVAEDGTRERIVGFDAPEVAHPEQGIAQEPGATLSTALSEQFVAQPGVTRTTDGADVYGRTLTDYRTPDESLAQAQLKRGLGTLMGSDIQDRRAFRQGILARRNPQTEEQRQINAQLDFENSLSRPNRANVKKKYQRDLGDTFSDAIDRGLDSIGLMVGGTQRLAGEMTGIDSLKEAGDRRIRRNQLDLEYNRPDIGTMDNVESVGDAVTYVVEKLGEQGPNLLATIGTAAATGGVGAALRLGATKLASEKLAVQAASTAMGTLGKGMTPLTGAALGAGTLNIGESKLHLDEVDPNGDHNLLALGTGLIKTGLDVGSLAAMPGIGRVLMPQARRLGLSPKEAMSALGQIPAGMARAAVIEGGTEGLQGLLDEVAGKYKAGVDINWENVRESAATGLITGGVFAAPLGVAEVGYSKLTKPADNAPAPPADAGTPQTDPAAELEALRTRAEELEARAAGLAPDTPELAAVDQELAQIGRRAVELQQAAPPAQGATGEVASGPTTPEPAADIAAQTAAAANPADPKQAVWVAGGGVRQARELNAQGMTVISLSDQSGERGLLASLDPALLEEARARVAAGESITQVNADLLQIPASKADAIADPNPVVLQRQTPEGAVVEEAVASQDEAPATAETFAERTQPGEQVVATTPEAAQQRRMENRRRRIVTQAAPKPVHPLDELQGRIDLAATPEERSALEAEADALPAQAAPGAARIPANIHNPQARFPETDRLWGRIAKIGWFRQHLDVELAKKGDKFPFQLPGREGRWKFMEPGRAVITDFVNHLKQEVIEQYNRERGADPTPHALNLLLREKVNGAWSDRQLVERFMDRYRTQQRGGWAGVREVRADDDSSVTNAPPGEEVDGTLTGGDPLNDARYAQEVDDTSSYAGNESRRDARQRREREAQEANLDIDESREAAGYTEVTDFSPNESPNAPRRSTDTRDSDSVRVAMERDARAAFDEGAAQVLSPEEVRTLAEQDRLAREGGLTAQERADILDGVNANSREGKRILGTAASTAEVDQLEGDADIIAVDEANSLAKKLFGGNESLFAKLDKVLPRLGEFTDAQALARFLAGQTPNRVLRAYLSALMPHLKGVKFVNDPDGTALAALGSQARHAAYDPKGRRIILRKAHTGAHFALIFLHEATHAATADALRGNASFARNIDKLLAIARERAEGLRDLDPSVTYGLKNADEFVAQLFSDEAFINFLESIPVATKPRSFASVLSEAIRFIANALGLRRNASVAAAAMEEVLFEIARPPGARVATQPLNAPSIRPAIDAVRNSAPVQRVVNAPANGKLKAIGRELVTGTGKAQQFTARAVQWLLSSDWQLRQTLTDAKDAAYANQQADRLYRRPGTAGTPGVLQLAETQLAVFRAEYETLLRRLSQEVVNGKKRGRDGAAQALADAWIETEEANAALARRNRAVTEARARGLPPPPQAPLTGLSDTAADLQKLMGRVASYIESAGVKGFTRAMEGRGYYLPQIYDTAEVRARRDEFVDAIVGLTYTDQLTGDTREFTRSTAKEFVDALLADHVHNAYSDLPWAGSLKTRTLTDPRGAAILREKGFMYQDVGNVIDYYLSSVTKQAEFEREFGGYAFMEKYNKATKQFERTEQFDIGHRLIRGTLRGLYDVPYGTDAKAPSYLNAVARAQRDGVLEYAGEDDKGNPLYRVWQRDFHFQRDILGTGNAQQRERMQKIIGGMMGNLGADMNPQWRRTQQWVLMVESITTLAFSTLSSLPELAVLASGAPDWIAFRDGAKKIVTKRSEAWDTLRALGFAGEHMAHIAIADAGRMNGSNIPRALMDKFFKLNGQHYWTQFTRAMAIQMFTTAAERWVGTQPNAKLDAFFTHYGLSRDEVSQWLDDGMPTMIHPDPNNTGTMTEEFRAHPVVEKLHRFVNEHVAMPNTANVPVFFNDPRFALLVQLKRFFYAYGGQVLMRVARETRSRYEAAVARGDDKAAAAIVASYPIIILGVASLPLAALAGELKEFVKYEAWGAEPPNLDGEGLAYYWTLLRRSGVLGPADLAVSLFDERSGGMESVAGPVVAHIDVGLEHGFFSQQFLRRSTPILGQMNGFWRE